MFKLATVLLLALLALPFLPDSVRMLLPEGWRLRLPRVEFASHGPGHGRGQFAGADSARANERDRVESSAMLPELSLDAVALEPGEDVAAAKPAHVPPTRRPRHTARRVVTPPRDEVEEPENVSYVPDYAVSMVPTRIQTEVRLSAAPASDAVESGGAARPAKDAENPARQDPARVAEEDDKDWPLLCGQVVDESGAPVAGAHVELESPRLSVSTDTNGRFCVACPAGDRTMRIDAAGRGRATTAVALRGSLFEMRIQLSQKP